MNALVSIVWRCRVVVGREILELRLKNDSPHNPRQPPGPAFHPLRSSFHEFRRWELTVGVVPLAEVKAIIRGLSIAGLTGAPRSGMRVDNKSRFIRATDVGWVGTSWC